MVTEQEVNYLVNEFQNNIFPKMTSYFGNPPLRDGSGYIPESILDPFITSDEGKIMIMVYNMVDDYFWDPTYPYYWQGFFDPMVCDLYDRNIVQLSNRFWSTSLGYDGPSGRYLYESTLTHEYEHLINYWHNPSQALFLDEGCAVYSQMLVGYGIPYHYFNDFLAQPDNSLITWGDQGWGSLADYGASGLFITYLADHFGPDLIKEIVASQERGAGAVNSAFDNVGLGDWTFNKAFNYWTLANLIHDDDIGKGMYNYKSIDISNDPGFGQLATLRYEPTGKNYVYSASNKFGNTLTPSGEDTSVSKLNAYSSDYISVLGPKGTSWSDGLRLAPLRFKFDGNDGVTDGWQKGKSGIIPPGWELASGSADPNPWTIVWEGGNDYYALLDVSTLGESHSFPIDETLKMTNGFSTIGSSSLSLRVTYEFFQSYYQEDKAEILMSVDGGESWSSIALQDSFWTGGYGAWTSTTINIDWAIGYPDVRLGIRYFLPEYLTSARYVKVNDLLIADEEGTIFSEGFDHGELEDWWWSGDGDEIDNSLVGTADLRSVSSATLSLETRLRVEGLADFAFVQVSEDNGITWKSLENEFTTYDTYEGALSIMVENLPGLSENFNEWTYMSFDLSEYAGKIVQYRFRLLTDSAWHFGGWDIRNIEVNGINVQDDELTLDPGHPVDDWIVHIYLPDEVMANGRHLPAKLIEIRPNERMETSTRTITMLTPYSHMIIIVSSTQNRMDYGFGILNTMKPSA